MTGWLDFLASALICPAALLYVFLLNDRWRARPVWRWLLFALSGPASVCLAWTLTFLPVFLRIAAPWVLVLSVCRALSAVRDARFFFAAATGLLFTYLSAAVCSMAACHLGVHRALLRLALDSALLLVGAWLFRPAFLRVYHTVRKGWLMISLMPLSLLSIFSCLLMVPDYTVRYTLPYVQGFTCLLALLTLIFYWSSFYFFHKLGSWQEDQVDSAVFSAQLAALADPGDAERMAEERRRILRHDLRHYLHILSACLRTGDGDAALRALDALEANVNAGLSAAEEASHGG